MPEVTSDAAGDSNRQDGSRQTRGAGVLVRDEPVGCRYEVIPPSSRPELIDKFADELDGQPPNGVREVIRLAKKWPQLNFVFHLNTCSLDAFVDRDAFPWCSAADRMPARGEDPNVYVVLGGRTFADVAISDPRLATFVLGSWVKCLGATGVIWGQEPIKPLSWEAELMRRFEIPECRQKQYGFPALGPPGSQVRRNISGENQKRLKDRLAK